MSQVNLLPPEILQRQKVQRLSFLVIGAAAAAIVLIFLFYLFQVNRLSSVDAAIGRQNLTNAAIQSRIANLQQYATLQLEAQRKQEELNQAYAYEVSFSQMLQDVSRVIPTDEYLTSLSFQVTPPTGPTAGSQFVGNMTAGGNAASVQTISSWLNRLGTVKGWENPWVTTITKATNQYAFSSGVDLSQAVLTARGQKAAH